MELPEQTKDITLEWLNEALHENEFLANANIESFKSERIGEGEGFNSDMVRLTLAFDRDVPGLPTAMITKLQPSNLTAREMLVRNNAFEREIRFLREIAPDISIRTPKLFYGAMDAPTQRYALLMEDCSFASPAETDFQGMTFEQTKIVANKIADFHALWWNAETTTRFPWMPKMKDGLIKNMDRLSRPWEACSKLPDFKNILPEGGWEAGLKLQKQLQWLINSLPHDKLTIIHGYLKSDNMFFDWSTPEDPLIVFDWSATTTIARAASELSFLLANSITTQLRRQVEKDIVKLYYARLLENGVSNYSFDECWTDYLSGLLLKTGVPLIQYGLRDHSSPKATKMVNTTLQRWFSTIVDNDATSILPDK